MVAQLQPILIDEDDRIILIPRYSIKELYGIAKNHSKVVDEIIKEIHEERKLEASS